MAPDNPNPQNAKRVGSRKSPENPPEETGQATAGIGNPQGQRTAKQQGAAGSADQGGVPARGAGLDQPGGPMPQDRGWEHESKKLRQGSAETEEEEG